MISFTEHNICFIFQNWFNYSWNVTGVMFSVGINSYEDITGGMGKSGFDGVNIT